MEDDATAPLIDGMQGRHRNNLYTLTIDDDPVIARNCLLVRFNIDNIEVHIIEEEDAQCIKKLITASKKGTVKVSLTLFSTTGKASDTINFSAKIASFGTEFSWDNTNDITKWIVTLTPQ